MCQDNNAGEETVNTYIIIILISLVEDQGRSVPRCPARTASRCPRSSAPVFPDNSASQCRGRYPGNSALIHHNNSAGRGQPHHLFSCLLIILNHFYSQIESIWISSFSLAMAALNKNLGVCLLTKLVVARLPV